MKLQDAIHERKSVMRFHHKKPDWKKIIRALDSVRFAPAAGNQFSMKFIIVQDADKIKRLAGAAQQTFVGTAQYVIVAISDDQKLVRRYGDKGIRYSSQQAGAAIQNLLLSLTEQKLATTWVGYFDEEFVRNLLEIPEDKIIEALFPIGLETKGHKTEQKKKVDLENVLYFDKWGTKNMEPQTRVRAEYT